MITTNELHEEFGINILKKLCCPICLTELYYFRDKQNHDKLLCKKCNNGYLIYAGLPILLVDDENWQKKHDEILGEVVYNTFEIPPEVHIQRNDFVNQNTERFLKERNIDLSKDTALIIGCSFSELEFFKSKCDTVICMDIVPALTLQCHKATRQNNMTAEWICADGECLPFEKESFDTVVVRQTLHHMLKYYSAISEFFRVCKMNGKLLIIDEPFSPPDLNDDYLSSLPSDFKVYDDVCISHIRELFKIPKRIPSSEIGSNTDIGLRDVTCDYQKPNQGIPESYLADKYHSFSLLNCIFALRLHGAEFHIHWPQKVAWNEEHKKVIHFCIGKNSNYGKSLLTRLTASGNVSIYAKKVMPSTTFRDRSSLCPIEINKAIELLREK